MIYEYRCPRCDSNRIKVGYPNYECLACGYTEPLSDFPISWDVHRSLSISLQGYDPGPCEPPEHNPKVAGLNPVPATNQNNEAQILGFVLFYL